MAQRLPRSLLLLSQSRRLADLVRAAHLVDSIAAAGRHPLWIARCEWTVGVRNRELKSTAGFSLVEVLVATAIVVTGVAALAQLLTMAADRRRDAGMTAMALVIAGQKLEQLRAEPGVAPPSPPGALTADTPGFVDFVDARGAPASAGALFTRRWSIEPIAGTEAAVLQVIVAPGGARLVSVKTRKAGG
jgi:type II secretory pathway pseudopilin PulG